MKDVKNIAASVKGQLTNIAKETGRLFDDLILYYAIERFLYRLSESSYCDRFILKGGLVLLAFDADFPRATRDIDFLGFTENTADNLADIVRQICEVEVEDDGLRFDLDSIKADIIKEQDDYNGIRVKFCAYLERSRASMQIDVGFGDTVNPPAELRAYPTLLDDSESPCIKVYPAETTIAEKFEAAVKRQLLTSRVKDFYDIWFISEHHVINGSSLCKALYQTFEGRGTSLPSQIPTYFNTFLNSIHTKQWNAMVRRQQDASAFPDYGAVLDELGSFLSPPIEAILNNEPFTKIWQPGTGWRINKPPHR